MKILTIETGLLIERMRTNLKHNYARRIKIIQ
jgi:hypothetical protein